MEVKFKTFLNTDVFKNVAKSPASASPKTEDRKDPVPKDAVPTDDHEPTQEEVEKFEELPDPMGPAI